MLRSISFESITNTSGMTVQKLFDLFDQPVFNLLKFFHYKLMIQFSTMKRILDVNLFIHFTDIQAQYIMWLYFRKHFFLFYYLNFHITRKKKASNYQYLHLGVSCVYYILKIKQN